MKYFFGARLINSCHSKLMSSAMVSLYSSLQGCWAFAGLLVTAVASCARLLLTVIFFLSRIQLKVILLLPLGYGIVLSTAIFMLLQDDVSGLSLFERLYLVLVLSLFSILYVVLVELLARAEKIIEKKFEELVEAIEKAFEELVDAAVAMFVDLIFTISSAIVYSIAFFITT